jgi:uncharacterized protein (TIGR00369 family)
MSEILAIRAAEQTSPSSGLVSFDFVVADWMCSVLDTMHGGCVSTMFDDVTTFAIGVITRPGFWTHGGVTRTLNCTYLRPVPKGAQVRIEVEVVHAGRRMITVLGKMRDAKGRVLAMCEHGKVSTQNSAL